MTILTEDGSVHLLDRLISNVNPIQYVAVGTGTNEDKTATDLGNRIYSDDDSVSNVTFIRQDDATLEAIIRVTGGVQVSPGTTITEVGVYTDDPSGNGTLIFIDSFTGVTVDPGHTEEFTIPIETQL